MTPEPRDTARLRLSPVGPSFVDELWRLHQAPGVAAWHGGTWTRAHAPDMAAAMGRSWARHGLGKWLAHDRITGELVGRGGLSRTTIAGIDRIEIGWAVREALWGRGYATEIGAAGLRVARDTCIAREVVAYTEVHNLRSRAVMERLGMAWVGEIRQPGLVQGQDGVHDDAPFVLYAVQVHP